MSSNTITIESLDMEGRGVGRLKNEDGTPGKVVFVEGALPGETVGYVSHRRKSKWEAATMTALHRESSLRVAPKCRYFGTCGGCAMQHLEPSAQVAIKQRVLEDNLWHLGRVRPETMLPPMHGPTWGYRYRARLSVRCVAKKGGVLVGFHECKSRYIADMRTCEILPPHVSALLVPLRELVGSLSIARSVPQIELAIGDAGKERITALVLRIMEPLSADDETILRTFADRHGIEWWLQPAGPDSAAPFHPNETRLAYTLPEFGLRMPFKPTDFTQVNHQINRALVSRALRLLDVQPQDRVADLFCGLGNFTLPIATRSRETLGIEGSRVLVERAGENARANGLDGRTRFQCRNLFELSADDLAELGPFDRMLIDPPRDGALAVCQALSALVKDRPSLLPRRIVYVSCSPATLSRDAGILVTEAGYALKRAGVINMFPHTAHVESIAVFDRASEAEGR